MVYTDRGGEDRRRIIVEIRNLRAHGVQQFRRGKVKLLQQHLGLVAELAYARRDVGALAQRVFQHGVGDGGNDGVGVRIAVARDVDGFHASSECPRTGVLYIRLLRMICGSILV